MITARAPIHGYAQETQNPINETRVRIPETVGSTLFGGWGVKL